MSKTILVVDDYEDVLDVYRNSLQPNYNLIAARRPSEALRKLSTNPSIELLITDLELPEMLGDELIVEAHKIRPNIRKVIVMARGLSGDIDAILRYFTIEKIDVAHLPKPVKADKLLDLVRSLIGE